MTTFEELDLSEFSDYFIHEKTLVLTKWNWGYSDFLKFQDKAHALVRKNKNLRVFIFCNHPHVYTMGRGNERGQDELVEFRSEDTETLPHEVFKIHRGGGITFHHPGQWIFYPIVAIKESYSLDDHMCWLLKSIASILKEEFDIDKVVTAKKLMGVWSERKKLASIGVGVNRFVTLHGVALNLINDQKTKKALLAIHPCGMSSDIYTSVSEVRGKLDEEIISNFHKSYLTSLGF